MAMPPKKISTGFDFGKHVEEGNFQCTTAPWVLLGDGNADKEAEELVPSPNYYVHSGLF